MLVGQNFPAVLGLIFKSIVYELDDMFVDTCPKMKTRSMMKRGSLKMRMMMKEQGMNGQLCHKSVGCP